MPEPWCGPSGSRTMRNAFVLFKPPTLQFSLWQPKLTNIHVWFFTLFELDHPCKQWNISNHKEACLSSFNRVFPNSYWRNFSFFSLISHSCLLSIGTPGSCWIYCMTFYLYMLWKLKEWSLELRPRASSFMPSSVQEHFKWLFVPCPSISVFPTEKWEFASIQYFIKQFRK